MNLFRKTLAAALLTGLAVLPLTPSTQAHETDQFLMPPDGEFADMGRYFSDYFGDALRDAVATTNAAIDRAERKAADTAPRPVVVGRKNRMTVRRNTAGPSLETLRSPMRIASAVRGALPDALSIIDGLEWNPPDMTHYGYSEDAIVIYKPHFDNAMHTDLHFILDPRIVGRLWRAGTFQAYDSYMGADKIGHFVDMGFRYYKVYDHQRAQGLGPQAASEQAIKFGVTNPLIGENALLGRLSAGAYSNADLASNYVGLLFYRNLTEPVLLQGERRPPMLELDDDGRWRIADHIANDPDFFRWFLSDHYNEALNPSHFEKGMQRKVRKAIAKRWTRVAAWYTNEQGTPRDAQWFADKSQELATYDGQIYGHCQVWSELYHLGNITPAGEKALALDR